MRKQAPSPPHPHHARGDLSQRDVFTLCKQQVYAPCKKPFDAIRFGDDLSSELGYVGDSRRLLASKTNKVFDLSDKNSFSPLEISVLNTVRDHIRALCQKLARDGLLIEPRVR